MRNRTLVALLLVATLIAACSPFLPAPTSTATATVQPAPSATLAFTSTAEPSPTARATASPTPTPTALLVIPTLAVPTLPPTLPATSPPRFLAPGIVGLSVGATVTFTSCAGTNPVNFNGTISTNTAMKVKYDWLLRGAAYFNSPSQIAEFGGPGTKKVFGAAPYNAQCGNYMLSLHIIEPSYMVVTKTLSIH
jgi:hypothetical protein